MSLHFVPTVWLSNFLYSSLFLPSLHLPTSYYYVLLLLLFSFLFFFFFPHWYLLTSSLFSSSSTEGKIKVDGQHAYRLLPVSLISSGPFTPKTLSNKHSKLRLWKTSKNGIQMLPTYCTSLSKKLNQEGFSVVTTHWGRRNTAICYDFCFFFFSSCILLKWIPWTAWLYNTHSTGERCSDCYHPSFLLDQIIIAQNFRKKKTLYLPKTKGE